MQISYQVSISVLQHCESPLSSKLPFDVREDTDVGWVITSRVAPESMSAIRDASWDTSAWGSTAVVISSLVSLMVSTESPDIAVLSKSVSFLSGIRPTRNQKSWANKL